MILGPTAEQPAYLDVPDFRKCLGSLEGKPQLCKPAERPEDCPLGSWVMLHGPVMGGKPKFTAVDCQDPIMKPAIEPLELADAL